MTTFTLQDLTPAQQEAVKQHEALHALNMNRINNVPTVTKEEFMEHGMNNPISASAIEYATQHAPVPQPSGENPHNIGDIINTICTQLQLLATVIKQQPSTTPPEGNQSLQETVGLVLQQSDWFKDIIKEEIESRVESEVIPWLERRVDFNDAGENSLQECVDTTLQQADWFKSMVRETIVDEVSLEDVVKDIVKEEVESAVDSYFRNAFDPTYHFDFGDAVCSEVSDQLDDVVRNRLDEVVQEQLEEVVAERLKSIRVVFD